jgi:hypothetical protein
MVADMSAVERAPARRVDAGVQFGTIVIVGGGCYGSYYVRQLLRARDAGAAAWTRVIVVDRDPHCAVAGTYDGADIELAIADWHAFFTTYLSEAAADRERSRLDAIVPTPLMPHLMFDWLVERARERWPNRDVRPEPLLRPPNTPWQRAAPDGTHYVSFAEWMCPINCIEPRRCPHTRGERTWSLPIEARQYVQRARERGEALAGPVIFHCVHRTYGVGMFDTREVLEGDELVRTAAEGQGAAILVGTMSHCHGAFARLVVGPPAHGSVESSL